MIQLLISDVQLQNAWQFLHNATLMLECGKRANPNPKNIVEQFTKRAQI